QVSGLTSVTAVITGFSHSLALRDDGTLWAWGVNTFGQLGDGTIASRTTPVLVSGLTSATALAAGFRHSLALRNDGAVWAWGDSSLGQFGDGAEPVRLTPVRTVLPWA